MRQRVVLAVIAVFSLLALSCGARLPDDVLAAHDPGRGGTGGPGGFQEFFDDDFIGDGGIAGPGGTRRTGQPGQTTTTGTGTGRGTEAREGPGEQGTTCGAGGATDTGVGPEEIVVANISTVSGPLPGATAGAFRGAAAYLAMVNATGGVCGRRVRLLQGDDGLDPARGRSEFRRLEPQVLSFVGSFAVADSGYLDLVGQTGVPYFGLPVDPSGDDLREITPRTNRGAVAEGPFKWWAQQHPNIRNAAMLHPDVGGVTANAHLFEAVISKYFDLVYGPVAVSAAAPDYTGEVRNMRDRGVEFVYAFAFEVNMHARLIRNMRQQNFDPPLKGSIIAFDGEFSRLLGSDGDGWQNHQDYLPFLDPAESQRSEATATFVEWTNRVFPGAKLDLFTVDGWGTAQLFVQALELIDGEITRQKLLDAAYQIQSWNRGGLGPPQHPTNREGTPCFAIGRHTNGSWVRAHPSNAFDCDTGGILQVR